MSDYDLCRRSTRCGRGCPRVQSSLDEDVLTAYSIDRAMYCPAGKALALVHARETADVQHVMRVASRASSCRSCRKARAAGCPAPPTRSTAASCSAWRRWTRSSRSTLANRLVVTQPGIFNADLSKRGRGEGLFYPPDPSSWEFCSIGGNIATNSGGLCCVKYGVTTDYVLGLEVVLADGEVLRTGRRTVKGVAGYDLTQLFVGSEGTLGVITEITLMLRPEAERPLTVAAVFDSAATAAEAVSQVVALRRRAVPAGVHGPGHPAGRQRGLQHGIAPEAGALLLAQSDAGGERAAADIAHDCQGASSDAGAIEVAVADDPAEGELLLAGRRQVLTAMEKLGTTMIDDVCVPRTRLAELIARIEEVSAACGLVDRRRRPRR